MLGSAVGRSAGSPGVISLASRPHDAVLGVVEGDSDVYDAELEEGGQPIPGLVIYRFDASLLFFNADHFKDRTRSLVRGAAPRPTWFIFDAESVPVLDVTGADALEELRGELAGQGVVLAIARAKGLFRVMLERTGVAERIGREHLFPTVHAGVRAFGRTQRGSRMRPDQAPTG